ncbi:hypothetical protein JW823_03070 [bacterium]|nr:hypothetical protein [candidate division CSSED10-310 bacterium]
MTARSDSGRDYSRTIRFCMDFQGLLKAVEMYTIEHIAAVDAAVRCQNSLRPLVFENSDVVISSDQTSMQIGTTFIPEKIIEKTPAFLKVHKLIDERKITSITIRPDVAPDDLLLMANTLTSPFEPVVAERQYEELGLKTRSRVKIAGIHTVTPESPSALVPLLLSGKMEGEITDATKEILFMEITRNIESTSRAIQKQLKIERQPDSQVCARDLLPIACDRWVHILGELLERVHSGEDTTSAERQRQILELMLPYLATIQESRRSEEFDSLISSMENSDIQTKIRLFAQYYDRVFQRVEELSTYRLRIQNLVRQLEKMISSHAIEKSQNLAVIRQDLTSVAPGTIHFPSLFEKLLYWVLQTREPELVQPMLFISLDNFTEQSSVPAKTIEQFSGQVLDFCTEFTDYCESTITGFLRILSDTPADNHPENFIFIIRNILETHCRGCTRIKKCTLLENISNEISQQKMPEPLAMASIELWQQIAHAILQQDFNIFRTRVTPLAENDLAPDRFDENGLQDRIADAWKSFAEAEYFQTLFKRLTNPERDVRFNTIDHLSKYGPFAVWLSLGGLGHHNWQLRRNLATIIGRVAPLDKPAFLKQVLRDRDWHVRFEVISALRRRVEEVADQIRNQKDHPLGKIITLALLDGRKEIREETYAVFESITPSDAVRGLINAYERLNAVSDDYEIAERTRILSLLGLIGKSNPNFIPEIIQFVTGIATQKEGLLTPHWMIPLKKASVECLEMIGTPESEKWIETLAKQRPYKRGVVGREARAALKRIAQ